ncbi:glycoside hydrolase family 2 protein [Fimicolochytrium jonesii]|uniref:glycoside hydrolase family 2 protein n=1 Tax=Fimicolochytrium jonesii TaxID=1396493 RepID=UPI0022FED692|nr:glycoside hydrolase family 2 protein [Fimicolochytrium jonesii]KAI8821024.1 glycoside hydrolase family 2 protein [Fimicolochytrium jonesii]
MVRLLHLIAPGLLAAAASAFAGPQSPLGDFITGNSSAGTTFNLSTLAWTVKNTNGSIQIPASVPGQVHLDLLKAGIIGEPYVEINEFYQRWIAYEPTWTYTAKIQNPDDLRSAKKIFLRFDGLDTACNISLFGQHVAAVANQFRQWAFDVTSIVQSPTNSTDRNITVAFQSPILYAKEVRERSEVYPPDAYTNQSVFSNREYIRKQQADFGWDWGPAFAPSGIWKPALLLALGSRQNASENQKRPQIHELNTLVDIYRVGQLNNIPPNQNANWMVNVSAEVLSVDTFDRATVTLSFPQLQVTSPPIRVAGIKPGRNFVTAHFEVDKSKPHLWWPVHMGKQNLYDLHISINPQPTSGLAPMNYTRRTAFRTIVLNLLRYPDALTIPFGGPYKPGDQFHFEVNGVTFFAKGANWVPADAFYRRITKERRRGILQSAVDANMNMVRVWAGGVYEDDEFYDLADEMGLLLWSELQFSISTYPADPAFLSNVIPEIEYNVRRINRHPSLALWVGNNEMEWFVLGLNATYRGAYGKHLLDEWDYTFVQLFQRVILSTTRSITYLFSSTTQGYLSGPDPWIARYNNKTRGELYGSAENWNFGIATFEDITRFPAARFVNEFGFHSMPSIYTWDEVLTSPSDYQFNSSVVVARNRKPPPGGTAWPNPNSPNGMYQMTQGVITHYPVPSRVDQRTNFSMWCHATQLTQAQFMQLQIESYRLGSGRPENNLGALVWQLNDIWQADSWSGVEYSFRWKILQYHLRRVYQPVIIVPLFNTRTADLSVYTSTDLRSTVKGTASLIWRTWQNGAAVNSSVVHFTTRSLNNTLLGRAVGLSTIVPAGYSANDVWLQLTLNATDASGNKYNHENVFTPVKLNAANLRDPELTVRPQRGTTNGIVVEASSAAAAYAWVDHPPCITGHFSDNSIFVIPGQSRILNFVVFENTCHGDWRQSIVIRSVWDYNHEGSNTESLGHST